MFGVSFLVAALEDHSPMTNTSSSYYVDNHMYLRRITFGSAMFLDLPMYATINGVNTTIYMAVQGQVSGELEDLVLVTLMFGPVTSFLTYEAAVSSVTLTSNATSGTDTPSPAPMTSTPTPTPTSVIRDSSGNVVPTQMLTKPRGVFGMCLDAGCATDGSLSMGFSGLRVIGSSPLTLARFGNSPAFAFSPPTRHTLTGMDTEVISSYMEAFVPQSAIRPPRKYDSSGSLPTIVADVALFLSDAAVWYGDQTIDVPRGAVKYTVEIRDWVFDSPGDMLVLSMQVHLTRSDGSLTPIASDYSTSADGDTVTLYVAGTTAIEFPRYAMADGNRVPVGVQFTAQDRAGTTLVVRFTFPSFTEFLTYDPVMKASPATPNATSPSTTSPTTTTPVLVLEKPKRKVDSWGVGGFLLGFLALVIVVSIIQCCKKAPVKKIDFTKIIP